MNMSWSYSGSSYSHNLNNTCWWRYRIAEQGLPKALHFSQTPNIASTSWRSMKRLRLCRSDSWMGFPHLVSYEIRNFGEMKFNWKCGEDNIFITILSRIYNFSSRNSKNGFLCIRCEWSNILCIYKK